MGTSKNKHPSDQLNNQKRDTMRNYQIKDKFYLKMKQGGSVKGKIVQE